MVTEITSDEVKSILQKLGLEGQGIELDEFVEGNRLDTWRRAFRDQSVDARVEGNYNILEFLGDKMMNGVLCRWLHKTFPGNPEGYLTELYNRYSSGDVHFKITEKLQLSQYAVVAGPALANGYKLEKDLFESVIGALCEVADDIQAGLSFSLCWIAVDKIYGELGLKYEYKETPPLTRLDQMNQYLSKAFGETFKAGQIYTHYEVRDSDPPMHKIIFRDVKMYAELFPDQRREQIYRASGRTIIGTGVSRKDARFNAFNQVFDIPGREGVLHGVTLQVVRNFEFLRYIGAKLFKILKKFCDFIDFDIRTPDGNSLLEIETYKDKSDRYPVFFQLMVSKEKDLRVVRRELSSFFVTGVKNINNTIRTRLATEAIKNIAKEVNEPVPEELLLEFSPTLSTVEEIKESREREEELTSPLEEIPKPREEIPKPTEVPARLPRAPTVRGRGRGRGRITNE